MEDLIPPIDFISNNELKRSEKQHSLTSTLVQMITSLFSIQANLKGQRLPDSL